MSSMGNIVGGGNMGWNINFGRGSSMMSTSTGDFYARKFLPYH